MDSYEYFLLYHKDSSGFINALSHKNDEILIALEKLIAKGNLSSVRTENEKCFDKIWEWLMSSKSPNERLDNVFQSLLTDDRFGAVKLWINEKVTNFGRDDVDGAIVLRVIRCVTKEFISIPTNEKFFLELSAKLVEILYQDSKYSELVDVLNLMVKENAHVGKQICDNIWTKSRGRQDPLALQNVCYFFDKMCVFNTEGIAGFNMLRTYFESSEQIARKQGIYLVNTLVHYKKFASDDEESFKKFTIITESLQESYHLILPTLDLLKSLKFSKPYTECVFLLLRMFILHESSLVKHWGISYILTSTNLPFNEEKMITVLSALNSTCLYDVDGASISSELLNTFIERNFDTVFGTLTEINWLSVPFYRVFEGIRNCIRSMEHSRFDRAFISHLLKQTEVIPKRIKNLVVRSGVQAMYAESTAIIAESVGVQALKQILINVFNMGEQHECLKECLSRRTLEDCEIFLTIDCPENFARFVLFNVSMDKTLDEIQALSKRLKNSEKLVMETIFHLSKTQSPGIETFVDVLNQNTSKMIISVLGERERETAMMSEQIEALQLEFRALRGVAGEPMQERLTEIWLNIKQSLNNDKSLLPTYWMVLKLIMEFHQSFDLSIVENEVFEEQSNVSQELIQCQVAVLKRQLERQLSLYDQELMKFLSCLERLVDDCYLVDHLSGILNVIKCVITDEALAEVFLNNVFQSWVEIISKLSSVVTSSDERVNRSGELVELLLRSVELSSATDEWVNEVALIVKTMMQILKGGERSTVVSVIMKAAETSKTIEYDNEFRKLVKFVLIEKILEVEMLSKDQQIEAVIGCEIESATVATASNKFNPTINDKKSLRMLASELLSKKFTDEFPNIIEAYMEDFAKSSKKKPRHFPNSWIHRYKLHCLQPIIYCEAITNRTVEILIHEMLNINNQPNVTYLIEIILARHCTDIVDLLKDVDKVFSLKAPALKSIFTIAVMHEKMPNSFKLVVANFFGIAERRVGAIHDVILPFMMGQNFGVRSYAQAAIVMLYKHVKSLFGTRDNTIISDVAKTCKVINESMQFKNASKFFESLKQDFRFALTFEKIWRVDTFYHHIPYLTKMTFEEIVAAKYCENVEILKKTDLSQFKIAVESENTTLVMSDEIAVPISDSSSPSSVNLQQKYLPYKYQVPGEKLMNVYPSTFQTDDSNQLCLPPKSNLIVVASLVSRAPNLGGLARTCEVFGVENYIIESLKLTENSDFKALSKTAEKWMKISELKPFKLFDYLLGMKQQGYCIVGAEQSGRSVTLTDAEIPRKSVLLLGNEKEGIPANLLSLLDLTIEIPQSGVVRSLNVHVSGAIVIWEYAKQHLLK